MIKEDVLPEGWEYEQLSKKTEIILGQSPKGIYVNAIGKGVPFYQGKTEFGDLYPTVKNYCEKPKKIAEKNNVLLSVRAPVGPTNLSTETTAIGRGLAAINCLDNDYKFILYQFRFIEPWLKNQGTGTTFQAITGNFIKNLKFIFPPLPEQQYLSQKLTALLDEVEQTKQRLEAIPALLKQFRQSVLADAVSGRLTEGNADKWNTQPLKSLTTKIGSGSTPKGGNDVYQASGIPFVRSLNIHTHFIKYEDLVFIDEVQAEKLKNVKIEENDVLLNITGASIGRVNIAPKEFVNGRVNQHVAIIRLKQEALLPKFLHLVLASPKFQKWIEGENYGTTRQALTKGMLEALEIHYPDIVTQTQIVQKVETYFALADEIETQVNTALENVNLLTQSILAKAFSGELSAAWRAQQAYTTKSN